MARSAARPTTLQQSPRRTDAQGPGPAAMAATGPAWAARRHTGRSACSRGSRLLKGDERQVAGGCSGAHARASCPASSKALRHVWKARRKGPVATARRRGRVSLTCLCHAATTGRRVKELCTMFPTAASRRRPNLRASKAHAVQALLRPAVATRSRSRQKRSTLRQAMPEAGERRACWAGTPWRHMGSPQSGKWQCCKPLIEPSGHSESPAVRVCICHVAGLAICAAVKADAAGGAVVCEPWGPGQCRGRHGATAGSGTPDANPR
mmetsp:Transcript_48304/g.154253  ORF Transcript_48304/g.154253 Transcript_48304/m.154253 type:complete len:265 (-) Transcript_48304:561-1355(-)